MFIRNRLLRKAFVVMISSVMYIVPFLGTGLLRAAAADAIPAPSTEILIHETINNGFIHPGVGLTKSILENMREQVVARKDPWYSYYNAMAQSPYATRNVTSSNASSTDPSKPKSVAVNSKGAFVDDGLKAYTQTLMYYITGDEAYRANAMAIIRIWEQMDPAQYTYFTDSHIHMGIPLYRMVTAAEVLRYSAAENDALDWTEKDTADFTNNLIHPMTETFLHGNNYFMNQHTYPLLGAMSGYIFTDNRERYNEGVEWFTVNETAVDQGQNGSIKQLFRLVDTDALTGEPVNPPRVQHVEMGRDQAHGAGDLVNAEILSRLLEAQDTKVDPDDGTVSNTPNAVNAYGFLDNRILKAADYFARFMLGYDTPWTPVAAHTDPLGNPTIIYKELSEAYRGRIGGNVYGLYYYYKYGAGIDMKQEAPYYDEMFNKRLPFYWESPDAGAEYWLYIPEEAAWEGGGTLPKASDNPDLIEAEHRFVSLDSHSKPKQAGQTAYVETKGTEQGSRISIVGSATSAKTIGLRIRTNGTAILEINGWSDDALTLPDTRGQWTYITYTVDNLRGLGDLIYFTIKGKGTKVDFDHIHLKASEQLTPPVFESGTTALDLFTYAGAQAPIRYEFAATDPNASEVVTYQIDHKPAGASFNESTGSFSWKPQRAGSYSFVIGASDGTSISAKPVHVVVGQDRESALAAVVRPYQETVKYLSVSKNRFLEKYEQVQEAITGSSDEVFLRQLAELRLTVTGLEELTPLLPDGSIDYSGMLVGATFYKEVLNLLDNYAGSFAFYGSAVNLTHTMDFGPNFKVAANAFGLQVRASFPERIGGTALFGSNDLETWDRLTPATTKVSEDMQRLEVRDEYKQTPYRYFKIQMIEPSSTMLELSEFRIYGERLETNNKLVTVSIASPDNVRNRVNFGDSVTLSFQSSEPIQEVKVSLQGQEAAVSSADQLNWTASANMDSSAPTGKIAFSIKYKTAGGERPEPAIMTTDGSLLYLVDETKRLDIRTLAKVTASDKQWGNGGLSEEEVGYLLFDSDPATFGDLVSGPGAYYIVDFGEGAAVRLSGIFLLPRTSYAGRMNGVVVQGSNDRAAWTDLTAPVTGAAEGVWTYLDNAKLLDSGDYRYLRIYNGASWNGNLAEAEFYGELGTNNAL